MKSGFESVRAAFERSFEAGRERGAAVAVWRDGEALVDLWGGWRDRARTLPWEGDTKVTVFSVTKGVVGLGFALLASRGELDYDARVADYWPGFAAAGKERITVRQLLAHEAGLVSIDRRVSREMVTDRERLVPILEAQRPSWEPGTTHGYHALTFGLYAAELMRRVDPQGRGPDAFVSEELTGPLGVDVPIGLPADVPASEVGETGSFPLARMLLLREFLPLSALLRFAWPWSLVRRSVMNPFMLGPGALAREPWMRTEFVSGTGLSSARSLARLFGAFATPGGPFAVSESVHADLTSAPRSRVDRLLGLEGCMSLGFCRSAGAFQFGSDERSFGMAGAGGAFAFADPGTNTGYAYVTAKMGGSLFDDPRERALRDAVYSRTEPGSIYRRPEPCSIVRRS